MLICISDILSSDQLAQLGALLERQDFADGSGTAGWGAASVKENLQLAPGSLDHDAMQALVAGALTANPVFALAAAPKVMRPILFSRYLPGMGYGTHFDNALMGEQPPIRADLAFTLYISPPEAYEGGELAIEEPAGTRTFKLPAGALILYPANSLHRVTQVTSGRRDVAVGWLQSLIRDHERRRILFELENLRQSLFAQFGKSPEFDTLSRNTSDLWRMWAEP